ncbi:MAG: 5-formyltetrahydrofolate cyclo-ligase [Actinomycetota bacterium]|nr:5-formyltetrahydrofolate cyclo-ligase [Actinomycetota bacterium]
MSSKKLSREKRELRRRMKALRDGLDPDERARSSRRIVERLLALPEVQDATTVSAYFAFGSEIPTVDLLASLDGEGRRIALPLVRDGEMTMVSYRLGDALAMSSYGANEPTAGAEIAPTEVDVFITPGLAFDRRGFRLGYGGGFYDRCFRRARPDALRVGVCYTAQLVEEVPSGPSDEPVDSIVTEEGIVPASTRDRARVATLDLNDESNTGYTSANDSP